MQVPCADRGITGTGYDQVCVCLLCAPLHGERISKGKPAEMTSVTLKLDTSQSLQRFVLRWFIHPIDWCHFSRPSCSLHRLQTRPVWQGRWLHPGGKRAWVLPEEDQGQERQIDVQLFDTSIKSKCPHNYSLSLSLLWGFNYLKNVWNIRFEVHIYKI